MKTSKPSGNDKPTIESLVTKECEFRAGSKVLDVEKVSNVSVTPQPNPNDLRFGEKGEFNVKFVGSASLMTKFGDGFIEKVYSIEGYANIEENLISTISVRER